jgi:hypothetical protein
MSADSFFEKPTFASDRVDQEPRDTVRNVVPSRSEAVRRPGEDDGNVEERKTE